MSLPPPHPRTHLHTRNVVFRGYRREDGWLDIEGELRDTKTHLFTIPGEGDWGPGRPIHDMAIRVTVDEAMVVREIAVAMDGVPHGSCPQALAPMQNMVGAVMGRGWRQAIERHLGGVQGCTHLRELLFNMATAAYQTVQSGEDGPGRRAFGPDDTPPAHLGKCLTWDFDGPVVQRHYPMFFRRDPKARPGEAAAAVAAEAR